MARDECRRAEGLLTAKNGGHTVAGLKTISSRALKRGHPEDRLSPGQSLLVKKSGVRQFELRRVDTPRRSHRAGLEEAMREVPNKGGPRTDVAAWCAEDYL